MMGGESSPSSPATPETPGRGGGHSPSNSMSGDSPGSISRFKKGHGRQSSLGTTMTSPSTRRRSLENTISMIREAMSRDTTQMGMLSIPVSHSSALACDVELTLLCFRFCFPAEDLAERVAAGNESPRSPSSPRNSMTGPAAGPSSPSPTRRSS